MKTVILDHAGSITIVTEVPDEVSLADVRKVAEENPRIESVNVAFFLPTDTTADEYPDSVAYECEEVPFALLSSHERGGCGFDECHSLSYGPEYRSEKYCDEHAGPVSEDYADVTVTWEGAVDTTEYHVTDRATILRMIDETETAVSEARASGTFDEELGAEVSVSYHSHEFDSREEYDKWQDCSDCWCESYDKEYDSQDDRPEPEDDGNDKIKMPSFWASYLINGDASGLEDGEQEHIDQYLRSQGITDVYDVADDKDFSPCFNLHGGIEQGGDLSTYTVSFAPEEAPKNAIGIDPAHYATVNAWLARGDGIAVYENQDLSSANAGHRQFVSFGSPAAQIESTTPPERLPDIGGAINFRYTLVATYKGSQFIQGEENA